MNIEIQFLNNLLVNLYKKKFTYQVDIKDRKSCHERILFLDICDIFLSTFSKKFFREHLFHHYLGISRDPVANLRLKFITLIPFVRHTLRLPLDSPMLQKLLDVTESLSIRDTDKQVIQAMTQLFSIYGPLDGQEYIQVQSFTSNSLKSCFSQFSLTDSYFSLSSDIIMTETQDKIKEEEEQKLQCEQIGSEWISKRREFHETRQDFHKRFGGKTILGNSSKFKEKSISTTTVVRKRITTNLSNMTLGSNPCLKTNKTNVNGSISKKLSGSKQFKKEGEEGVSPKGSSTTVSSPFGTRKLTQELKSLELEMLNVAAQMNLSKVSNSSMGVTFPKLTSTVINGLGNGKSGLKSSRPNTTEKILEFPNTLIR